MYGPDAAIKEVRTHRFAAALLIWAVLGSLVWVSAEVPEIFNGSADPNASRKNESGTEPADAGAEFRLETVPVAGGAEILTIFARPGGRTEGNNPEVPLVSILRDTLGDSNPDNDQLRYLWMLTYTKASLGQNVAAFVPFLYTRTSNNNDPGSGPPPPVTDLRRSDRAIWNAVLWTVFKKLVLGQAGIGVKASVLQYSENRAEYQRSAVARALSILSLYQSVNREKVLSESEMKDIQARLWLTDKPLGWHMQDENLTRVYDKELSTARDFRGHNWELLRQYSEAQGLYFEPMEMPDGTARHAIVWVAAEDLGANKGRKFEGRFLNIRPPWNDQRLDKWKGYSEVRWFDAENRVVADGTPDARSRTMLPLAIYGLDNPKIPTLLVDFRDSRNPRRREMTKRVLNDVTSNVLSLSPFSNLPYFFGRYLYDFATGRRGMDINQSSRVRSYAQLKTLLSLDASMDGGFRDEIAEKLETVSLNPLENDLDVESRLARKQYENLMAYAKRPDGLPAKLDKERREEMVKLVHGGKDRAFYRLGHFLTLGVYTHREKSTPQLVAALDVRRQLHFHERIIREIAFTSAKPEIDSNVHSLKRSLLFISQNGAGAEEKTTRALARIFAITGDDEMRSLCVSGLYRVNNSSARKQLLAIYNDQNLPEFWRSMSARYLKQALSEGQQMSVRDAEVISGISTN